MPRIPMMIFTYPFLFILFLHKLHILGHAKVMWVDAFKLIGSQTSVLKLYCLLLDITICHFLKLARDNGEVLCWFLLYIPAVSQPQFVIKPHKTVRCNEFCWLWFCCCHSSGVWGKLFRCSHWFAKRHSLSLKNLHGTHICCEKPRNHLITVASYYQLPCLITEFSFTSVGLGQGYAIISMKLNHDYTHMTLLQRRLYYDKINIRAPMGNFICHNECGYVYPCPGCNKYMLAKGYWVRI